ncbi:hypothetical protein [Enterobacter phage 04_vB_Eclo_IJM]|nr:hypothetical protein [Enterobacter phage 04_vB_Eclo_IJM]
MIDERPLHLVVSKIILTTYRINRMSTAIIWTASVFITWV